MGAEHRRHHRYDVDLPIVVLEGKTAVGMAVKNVSFDGLLLMSETSPALRKLLRLEMLLPTDGESIRLTAMAVHVAKEANEDGMFSVGIQFFGLEPTTRQRWDRFIVDVRTAQSSAPSDAAPTSKPPPPPRLATGKPKVLEAAPPELRIALDSADAVEAIRDEVLSRRELFVRTEIRIGLGLPVWVTFVHPATGRSISLPAKVRMQHAEPSFIGLSVRVSLDEVEREAFDDFATGGVSVTIDFESTDIVGLEEMEGRVRAPLAPNPDRPPGMIA